MVKSEIDELISEARNTKGRTFSYKDIEGLPDPVQRYFRYALKDGQKYIRFARMKAVGGFRRPGQERWTRATASEYFTTEPPGLIFDAVMKQNRVLWFDVRDKYHHGTAGMFVLWFDVRDKYHHGTAGMFVNVLSGFNVLDESDVRELNITTLLRWAGEAVMFPTALLPSEYIRWEPIDKNSAKAIITDGNNTGTYRFYFNDVGEIVRYESDDRYDRIEGRFQKVRSIAHRSHYKEIDGIRVPTKFLIVRILPDGTHEEFWKGEVTDIQFNVLARY
jgi:hypothetical protein